jgi:hypothetical protein
MHTEQLMEKIAEVAPEQLSFLVKSADEVKSSPFRDEILLELDGIVKHAGMGGAMAGRFGNAMAGIGASVGAGIAYSLAGDLYDAARRGITKSRNYKNMMQDNPDLENLPAKNVQQAFSALHRFNPEFASDPTVAGSFVRRQATLEEFDPQMLTQLVGARKNLVDTKKLPIPGRNPWDKPEEKDQRRLQSEKLRKDLSGDGGLSDEKTRLEIERLKGENKGIPTRNRMAEMKLEDEQLNRAADAGRGGGGHGMTARMRKFVRGM